MCRANLLKKIPMLVKTEGKKRRGQQRMRWLDDIINSMDMNFEETQEDSEGQGSVVRCHPWVRRVGHDWATWATTEQYYFQNNDMWKISNSRFLGICLNWSLSHDFHTFFFPQDLKFNSYKVRENVLWGLNSFIFLCEESDAKISSAIVLMFYSLLWE